MTTEVNRRHVPVLSQDVIRYLAVREGGTYLDCTLGFAGHASQIARLLGPDGHLIGFDRDPLALELAGQRLKLLADELGDRVPKVTLIGEAFSSVAEHVKPGSLDGLLADFGVSSMQIDEAERGFSFQADGPLDMRQDTRQALTAAQVVNEMDESDLANLIYEYGEERRSRRIARAIVRARPVTTTGHLARVVAGSAPAIKNERIHPATRTFQALRIHVNRELDEIRKLLEAAPGLLKPALLKSTGISSSPSSNTAGRLVVISFHSLEDRIAKDVLRETAAKGIWTVLTRKPVVADESETDHNPRARSAKLRAAEMGNEQEFEKRPDFRDVGSGVQRTGFQQLSGKKQGKASPGQDKGPKSKAAGKKKKRLRD
ncbi:16S rRNA (cytosine(1402)-N(4))-methyltransferase RsmH [Acidicapsa ligni]|uniref:16S rRNA (cytosine(1402)-N(4))-methyltransferase RsmH n=1 Tax=Acidicapsa ligni TaxID=542300 RepID=UPI00295AFB16|nr:16S rRNA (cytosine(1402)-N(4))-methyltransferase RsmH [Acidicapsa ligni]